MIVSLRMLAAFVMFSITALTSLAASAQQAAQNPRIAIVIGNATYRDAALATTANDAGPPVAVAAEASATCDSSTCRTRSSRAWPAR